METDQIPAPAGEKRISLNAGDVLGGRFHILKLIGSGGMACVYLARDAALNREAALKVYSKAGLKASALERIRREVAVARDLQHPGLVRHYDIHEAGDYLALSMEHIQGDTLQARIVREDSIREEELLPILTALAGALDHLHARGIIHRDIKPSNIFLTGDGSVKLGDFGIIHLESEEGLTRTGETVGTPTHMSPEQFQGRDLTPASDYYALGVTLYQAITGSPPFSGTYGELAVQHMEHAPPVLPRGVASPGMRRLVQGLLIKDPFRRWGKAEVDRFLKGGRLPFLPRQRSAMVWSAVTCLILGTLVLAGIRLRHPEPTHIRRDGERLACYREDRLLWERVIPGLSDACLTDVEGDGSREVVIGKQVTLDARKDGLRLDVLRRDGSAGDPLPLGGRLGQQFSAFGPAYVTTFQPVSQDRFAVFLNHRMFYPTYGFIWDAQARGTVFSLVHSGRFYSAVPFGRGVALEGINNRLLHQRVLLVTDGLAGGAAAGLSAVDDLNLVFARGIRAYHLLGSEANLRLEGPDAATLRISGEPPRKLRPDAAFEGMASGSAARSVEYLEEYRQLRDIMTQGGAAQAGERLDDLIGESRKLGHIGYSVLFSSLRSEALLRMGDAAAVETAVRAADDHPAYGMDLRIQAGLYALLGGDARRAVGILQNASNATYGGRREEVRTILVWASMLESPQTGRAMLELESGYIPSGLFWKSYAQLQEGWILLLEKDAAGAREALAASLKQEGMENHAAGYFLASIITRTFDGAAFEAFMARTQTRPEYLHWLGALGKGDAADAALHWRHLKEDAYHAPDSALMLALLTQAIALYEF